MSWKMGNVLWKWNWWFITIYISQANSSQHQIKINMELVKLSSFHVTDISFLLSNPKKYFFLFLLIHFPVKISDEIYNVSYFSSSGSLIQKPNLQKPVPRREPAYWQSYYRQNLIVELPPYLEALQKTQPIAARLKIYWLAATWGLAYKNYSKSNEIRETKRRMLKNMQTVCHNSCIKWLFITDQFSQKIIISWSICLKIAVPLVLYNCCLIHIHVPFC